MIGHGRWRRDVVDEALGLLPPERASALHRHLQGCPTCREERERVQRALSAARLSNIPAHTEPPVDVSVLAARVAAEIDRRLITPPREGARGRWLWVPAFAAAGLVMVAVLLSRSASTPPVAVSEAAVSEEAMSRLERTANREQTARYLQDAQGVLLSVASALPRCERVKGRREVGPEAAKSRELLVRRRLLVDAEAGHLALARPLLEDVDRTLAEIASLDGCSDPAELRAIVRRIAEDRLLMKIDLTARELQG